MNRTVLVFAPLLLAVASCGSTQSATVGTVADSVAGGLLSEVVQGSWACLGTAIPTDASPFADDEPAMRATIQVRGDAWKMTHQKWGDDGDTSDGGPEYDWLSPSEREGRWIFRNGTVELTDDDAQQFATLGGVPEEVREGDAPFLVSGVGDGSVEVTWGGSAPTFTIDLPSDVQEYPFEYTGGDTRIVCTKQPGEDSYG